MLTEPTVMPGETQNRRELTINQVPSNATDEVVAGLLQSLEGKDKLSGIYTGFTNEQYHQGPGTSASCLKIGKKTLAHLQAYMDGPPEPSTTSQLLGSGCHAAILEPELFKKSYVHRGLHLQALDTAEDMKGRLKAMGLKVTGTKAVLMERLKEADGSVYFWADVVDQVKADGGEIINKTTYDKIILMRDAVMAHPIAKNLFTGGVAEASCYARHENGLLMKCRPDYAHLEDGIVVDLKYFNDLTDEALTKQCFRMQYHWQSAWYMGIISRILARPTRLFYHVFVEEPKNAHSHVGVRVAALDDAALEKAEQEYGETLARIAGAMKTGHWPSYPVELLNLSLPTWAWSD